MILYSILRTINLIIVQLFIKVWLHLEPSWVSSLSSCSGRAKLDSAHFHPYLIETFSRLTTRIIFLKIYKWTKYTLNMVKTEN